MHDIDAMVRIVCAVLIVLVLGTIVLRRREDEKNVALPADGPDLVGYALLVALGAVVVGCIWPSIFDSVIGAFQRITGVLTTAAAQGQ